MKYQISKDEHLSYYIIRLSGPFSIQDLESCYVDVINHPQWLPDTDVLWDAQQCTFEHLSGEDLNLIGCMTLKYKEQRGQGKAAWVVGREIDFAISRMFAIFNEERVVFDFRVFRDVEDAQKFVGSDSAPS